MSFLCELENTVIFYLQYIHIVTLFYYQSENASKIFYFIFKFTTGYDFM